MTIIFIIFFILVLLPFLPAIDELVHPKDNKPLSINPNYIKDAHYFDQSFKNILMEGIGETDATPGEKKVKLSKKEIVEIANTKNIKQGETVTKILYIKGDLSSGKKVKFEKKGYIVAGAIGIISAIAVYIKTEEIYTTIDDPKYALIAGITATTLAAITASSIYIFNKSNKYINEKYFMVKKEITY